MIIDDKLNESQTETKEIFNIYFCLFHPLHIFFFVYF